MAITNGQPIEIADLNAMVTSALGLVQVDNAQLPLGGQFDVFIPSLVVGTALAARRKQFVAPCDLLIETVAVQVSNFTAASFITVDVEGDGALVNWPIHVEELSLAGGAIEKLDRVMYDGTPTHPNDDPAGTQRAFRVFPRGSTINITAETDSVATPSTCQIAVVWRQFFQRE